jgi:hypothetical protein
MEKKKWPQYFIYIGGACLLIALLFGKYLPFGLWAGLIISGVTMTISALFVLGLFFNTYLGGKKITNKNGPASLFRERDIDEGIGWTLNFEHPYAAPLLIFIVGITPAISISMSNKSIYPLLVFALLVSLPFIIRKFRKP